MGYKQGEPYATDAQGNVVPKPVDKTAEAISSYLTEGPSAPVGGITAQTQSSPEGYMQGYDADKNLWKLVETGQGTPNFKQTWVLVQKGPEKSTTTGTTTGTTTTGTEISTLQTETQKLLDQQRIS